MNEYLSYVTEKTDPWIKFMSKNRVYFDSFHPTPRDNDEFYRVLNHFSEPPTMMSAPEKIIEMSHHYNLILTYSDEVCAQCANAIYFPFGSCWVDKKRSQLKPGVSFIFSEGAVAAWKLKGYDQRVEVLENIRSDQNLLVDVYYSTQRKLRDSSVKIIEEMVENKRNIVPLTGSKAVSLQNEYQIVIKNESRNGFFTEKLVDCFAKGVVPIYIGCPNISEFFDTKGIVHCSDVPDVISAVKKILGEQKLYDDQAVSNNFELVEYWTNIKTRIQSVVESALLTTRSRQQD